ncbi:cupin domain-containing protein [Thermoleophilia bacterium SCSIO 60948]|nr:cupin domain-containing protein [Thermoleophilia bacterium SCSIO 60948]
MSGDYTKLNLADVEDVAPANGFGDHWEARAARRPLGMESTGAVFFRIRPGMRSPFTHRHREAEETYVVLSGSGRIKVGADLHDVEPLDTIRVAAQTPRAFEAGPDGLELLAFGPHHVRDGEAVADDWTDAPER